ncbi:MAG: 30S ribosome-binding factor RbfA [Deltaproteobacteria bacterium]|nr:MAG: 30S ribosome-binding factor RbfA [Deltaproteobacteria bacterium]
MTSHHRPERVAQMVQELLGELFARGMRDPRIGLVTITGVKMSPDLREARVFWTVHGDAEQRKHTGRGLDKARGFLRHEIGVQLKLRVTPELSFTYDEAIDRGERIEQLIRQVHDEERSRPPAPASPEHEE